MLVFEHSPPLDPFISRLFSSLVNVVNLFVGLSREVSPEVSVVDGSLVARPCVGTTQLDSPLSPWATSSPKSSGEVVVNVVVNVGGDGEC